MNILTDTSGEWVFKLKDNQIVTYTDWNDIPGDLDIKHVIKFKPNIPPSPHTPEIHAEIGEWNERLTNLLEIERNARSNKRR